MIEAIIDLVQADVTGRTVTRFRMDDGRTFDVALTGPDAADYAAAIVRQQGISSDPQVETASETFIAQEPNDCPNFTSPSTSVESSAVVADMKPANPDGTAEPSTDPSP